MTLPTNKVDMAQMNAAIDKVLALPSTTQVEVKERHSQRKTKRPLLPKDRTGTNVQPAVR
jgi:hypothetical protein